MYKLAAVYPVLPGKDVRTVADMLRERPSEYAESRRGAGVQLERGYEQETPMGTFFISYIETERPFPEVAADIARSDLAIDRDFAAAVKEVHGVDITQPLPGEPPEMLGDWEDETVTARRRGLAFCVPVRPGATDLVRAFCAEAYQTRRDEFAASRRPIGGNRESVFLNHTPSGDIVAAYIEGNDPVEENRKFAESRSPFDVWFKEECKRFFPPDVDFNQPLPPITEVFDSQEILVAR
jgi:hypothetical protein